MPTSTWPVKLGRGSSISSSWLKRCRSSSISRSSTEGFLRSMSMARMLAVELEERWLSGLAVRVNGDVVPVELDGEVERCERVGEKAVLRRRREPLRRGVKDWKRFWRTGDTMLTAGS